MLWVYKKKTERKSNSKPRWPAQIKQRPIATLVRVAVAQDAAPEPGAVAVGRAGRVDSPEAV